MRDINRIDNVCAKIAEQWKRLPDWRFGQLMVNFMSAYGDPFYWEEDDFLEYLKEYIDESTVTNI